VLAGKRLAVTGRLGRPRREVTAHLRAAGAEVKPISRKTDWLVVGEAPSTETMDKAARWEVATIDETAAYRLMQ
jgi:NAD-dependent DNA ligase